MSGCRARARATHTATVGERGAAVLAAGIDTHSVADAIALTGSRGTGATAGGQHCAMSAEAKPGRLLATVEAEQGDGRVLPTRRWQVASATRSAGRRSSSPSSSGRMLVLIHAEGHALDTASQVRAI